MKMTLAEENRLLKWKLSMRDRGYVGPFLDEFMLKKIRRDNESRRHKC